MLIHLQFYIILIKMSGKELDYENDKRYKNIR